MPTQCKYVIKQQLLTMKLSYIKVGPHSEMRWIVWRGNSSSIQLFCCPIPFLCPSYTPCWEPTSQGHLQLKNSSMEYLWNAQQGIGTGNSIQKNNVGIIRTEKERKSLQWEHIKHQKPGRESSRLRKGITEFHLNP